MLRHRPRGSAAMPPMTRPGPGPARPHRPQIKPWERRRRAAAAAAAVNVSPVIRPKGTFKRGRGRPPGKAARGADLDPPRRAVAKCPSLEPQVRRDVERRRRNRSRQGRPRKTGGRSSSPLPMVAEPVRPVAKPPPRFASEQPPPAPGVAARTRGTSPGPPGPPRASSPAATTAAAARSRHAREPRRSRRRTARSRRRNRGDRPAAGPTTTIGCGRGDHGRTRTMLCTRTQIPGQVKPCRTLRNRNTGPAERVCGQLKIRSPGSDVVPPCYPLGRKRARTDEHPVLATPGDRGSAGA